MRVRSSNLENCRMWWEVEAPKDNLRSSDVDIWHLDSFSAWRV